MSHDSVGMGMLIRWSGVLATVLLGLLLGSPVAQAQSAPDLRPIVDRNFRLDLYEGVVFGSPRLVAMGGAAFAVGEGASGLFTNPAAAAIRSGTQSDKTSFSAFFNSYIPVSGIDVNNSGNETTQYRSAEVYAPGLLLQSGRWGVAVNLGYSRYDIAPQAGGGLGVRSIIPHLAVGRRLFDNAVTVGIGLRGALLNVFTREASTGLFTQYGVSGELGAVWQPRTVDFRLALAAALPVYSTGMRTSCDPNDCSGYILPNQTLVPWTIVVGTGWRFAKGRWNQPVEIRYRDELQLTVGLDMMVTGALDNAYGIEAFAAKQLQPSGRDTTLSPRLGAEAEVLPGWIRIRGGTYWEPSRYPGIFGRWHSTAGAELRVLWFHLHGEEYRISLSLAGDFASRYHNVGASLGLWN